MEVTATPQKLYYVPTLSEKDNLESHGYNITVKLGQGGYSKVYVTEFTRQSLNKQREIKLACKIIDTAELPPKFVTKFLPQELKVLSQLNHPHIIQIHSIFQRREKFYIFMRLAENGDLFDYVVTKGPVNEDQAKIWVRQLSLAIQYLHILEIAHRDIKCENILITIHNNVKLSDFGFCRQTVDNNNQAILSETYCGSTSYASPQIIAGEPYNPKATDLWSLGCVIFVMLNKTPPFHAPHIKIMYEYQLKKYYKFREKFISRYSSEVKILVNNLLEPKENLRFKIEQVLGSPWISLEPTLRILNKLEVRALSNAMEVAKRFGTGVTDPETIERRLTGKSIRSSILPKKTVSESFLKEYEEGFDLQLIDSQYIES